MSLRAAFARAAAVMAQQGGTDLLFHRDSSVEPQAVRVIVSAPEQSIALGMSSLKQHDARLYVEVAALPVVQEGNQFTSDDRVYSVVEALLDEAEVRWICLCTVSRRHTRGGLILARDAG